MSSAMAAGASSSCAIAFNRNLSAKANSNYLTPNFQKTTFQGLSLQDAKRVAFNSLIAESISSVRSVEKRSLEITARTAGAAKNIEVEVDKPLGLTLGQKSGGGVVITAVESGGNAAKAGLKVGDQVIYTSSFFGDELWPADKLGFTKTAIQAKPDSVYFVVSRGVDVDVKRLPKRPAPPAFGRKLTEAQKARIPASCYILLFILVHSISFPKFSKVSKTPCVFQARATHICLDCGYIYTLQKPFDEQPDDYACPQCRAPKKRFSRYDVNTGKAVGGNLPPIGVIIGLIIGIGGVGALLVYGLQ